MGTQVFISDDSFAWPDNVVRLTAILLSQGGNGFNGAGGGGAGGNWMMVDIFKDSAGSDSLDIEFDYDATLGHNGGDIRIKHGSDVVAQCKGGKGGTSTAGGDNNDITFSGFLGGGIVLLGYPGGAKDSAGGGGGAAYPATKAAYILSLLYGLPDGNGHQGGPAGDGKGGKGYRAHPSDAPAPGDGGDNTADGVEAGGGGGSHGVGAKGKVLFMWGGKLGATQFSSGKCCSICDIAKKFPDTVNLKVHFTPASDPAFDPMTVTCGDIDFGVGIASTLDLECATHDEFFHADGQTVDSKEQNNAIVGLFNAMNGKQLELIDYSSDVGSVTTDHGEEKAWFCAASYACPLAPSTIDDNAASMPAFLATSDRWCFVGEHPAGLNMSPSITHGSSTSPDCGNETFYWWKRFGKAWGMASAGITIWVTAGQKWYSEVNVGPLEIDCELTGGADTDGDNPPTANNFGVTIAGGWTELIAPASGQLGPFDTPDEAFDAIKAWVGSVGILNGEYNPAAANSCGSLYDISTSQTGYCGTEPNGFVVCAFVSASAGYASVPKISAWYCDPVTTGITW